MEKFELGTDAVREVKRLSKDLGIHDKILLAYEEYGELYYVTDDKDELEEAIQKRWIDGGCDDSPEDHAREFKIWEYSSAENKAKYPNTYKRAKPSLITSEIPLIRRTKEVELNYSVEFVIGY